MLFSVSTIKDSKDNLEFFIRENRLSGIDHMFIFYEGELNVDPCIYSYVTFISSDLLNRNEVNLNQRQINNNNRIAQLLCSFNISSWITCIDGDEVLNFDKCILDKVEPSIVAIRLTPIEPVNIDNDVAYSKDSHQLYYYKTVLTKEQLEIAHLFGFISEKNNNEWLSGHTKGKYIARIDPKLKYNIHTIVGGKINSSYDANLIHYDNVTFNQYLEKFKKHSGNVSSMSPKRKALTTFFRIYSDKPAFKSLAYKLYEDEYIEASVNEKVGLGFLFRLNRKYNPSINIHFDDGNINQYISNMDFFLLHDRYANSLRDVANRLLKMGEKSESLFFYKLANKSRPKGEFIINKIDELNSVKIPDQDCFEKKSGSKIESNGFKLSRKEYDDLSSVLKKLEIYNSDNKAAKLSRFLGYCKFE